MIALSHPTGNANVRGALEGLREANQLSHFYTTLGFTASKLDSLPNFISQKLQRRSYSLHDDFLSTRPLREAIRLSSKGRFFTVDNIYQDLDRHVAGCVENYSIPDATSALYCYEDGAELTFKAASTRDLHCVYEQPIGYWRAAQRIFQEEAELKPEWAKTLEALQDSQSKLERKDRELSMAEHVIAASSFTQQTLKEYPGDITASSVIPYGATPNPKPPELLKSGKLRVLFVGGLSQRKGLSYLFDAVSGAGSMLELTVVGRSQHEKCKVLRDSLAKHRWIQSIPNAEVLKLMRKQDVLVFPSLFEGFGLVLIEALSQGVPIIATAHTAAPDIIDDGREGFIVPIRDTDAIRQKLELLSTDSDRLNSMKLAAWERSKELSWERYGNTLAKALKPYCIH